MTDIELAGEQSDDLSKDTVAGKFPVQELIEIKKEKILTEKDRMTEALQILEKATLEINILVAELSKKMEKNDISFSRALESGSLEEVSKIVSDYEPLANNICKENGIIIQRANEILRSINLIKLSIEKE